MPRSPRSAADLDDLAVEKVDAQEVEEEDLPAIIDDPAEARCEVIEADVEAMIQRKSQRMLVDFLDDYAQRLKAGEALKIFDKYFILACYRHFAAVDKRLGRKQNAAKVIDLTDLNEQEVEILWKNSQRRLLEGQEPARGNGGGGAPIPHAEEDAAND